MHRLNIAFGIPLRTSVRRVCCASSASAVSVLPALPTRAPANEHGPGQRCARVPISHKMMRCGANRLTSRQHSRLRCHASLGREPCHIENRLLSRQTTRSKQMQQRISYHHVGMTSDAEHHIKNARGWNAQESKPHLEPWSKRRTVRHASNRSPRATPAW